MSLEQVLPCAQELKAKKLEMAKLRIQLQQAENRNIILKREAEERNRKAKEAAEFEAMKLRVQQLELLVAENAAINPAKVRPLLKACPLEGPFGAECRPSLVHEVCSGLCTSESHMAGSLCSLRECPHPCFYCVGLWLARRRVCWSSCRSPLGMHPGSGGLCRSARGQGSRGQGGCSGGHASRDAAAAAGAGGRAAGGL
jgi:hypothetical protein